MGCTWDRGCAFLSSSVMFTLFGDLMDYSSSALLSMGFFKEIILRAISLFQEIYPSQGIEAGGSC